MGKGHYLVRTCKNHIMLSYNITASDSRNTQLFLLSLLPPVGTVIDAARAALYTGNYGDGKLFIYDIENVIKVRTGEEGYDALQDTDEENKVLMGATK